VGSLSPGFQAKNSGIRQVGFVPPALPIYRGRDVARKVEDAKVKVGQDVRARCELLFALDAASLEAIDLAEKAGRCGVNVALKLAACSWP
jgi:hypothetical protein